MLDDRPRAGPAVVAAAWHDEFGFALILIKLQRSIAD
jgi:hypothetical protein